MSQNASAQATVDLTGLTVPDAERVLAGQDMSDVRIVVDSQYAWDANVAISGWELRLRVGSAASTADIVARAEPEQDIGTDSLTGEETLSGSLLSASDFTADQFSPARGRRSIDVTVIVEFDVFRDGEVIKQAQAQTTAEITVRREEIEVTSTVAGEGTIEFETG